MQNKTLVSIIIPTYNRAYILGKAIESVRAQTYTDWELVIVDDGSTDSTRQLVESYNDPRIKYVYQKNAGQANAKSRGMEAAAGEWFVYLDSDNVLRKEHLTTMLEWIKNSPKTLWGFPAGTRFIELYENGKLVKSMNRSDNFPEKVTPQDIVWRKLYADINGSFHHRCIYEKGFRFDQSFIFDDWDHFMNLSEKYPDNFLYIPIVLYDYWQRYGGDSLNSTASYRKWADQFERMYQKHKNDRLMAGQNWYPNRVEKWNKLADDYEKGLLPPYHLYLFQQNTK